MTPEEHKWKQWAKHHKLTYDGYIPSSDEEVPGLHLFTVLDSSSPSFGATFVVEDPLTEVRVLRRMEIKRKDFSEAVMESLKRTLMEVSLISRIDEILLD